MSLVHPDAIRISSSFWDCPDCCRGSLMCTVCLRVRRLKLLEEPGQQRFGQEVNRWFLCSDFLGGKTKATSLSLEPKPQRTLIRWGRSPA